MLIYVMVEIILNALSHVYIFYKKYFYSIIKHAELPVLKGDNEQMCSFTLTALILFSSTLELVSYTL